MTKKIGPVRRKYREFRIIQPEKRRRKNNNNKSYFQNFLLIKGI